MEDILNIHAMKISTKYQKLMKIKAGGMLTKSMIETTKIQL